MLISFEGVDGSGKSTQIKLLKEKLIEQNYEVTVFREPGGTELSEKIRKLLLDFDYDINPVTELLLFSAARSQLVAERVRPLLQQNCVVILDRYYDSTTAYQGFGRESVPLESIAHINEIATHRLEPDITFYLRIPIEEAEKRTADHAKDRMEKSGKEFYQKVIKGFDYLAEKEERFLKINSTDKVEIVHQQIFHKTLEFLEKS